MRVNIPQPPADIFRSEVGDTIGQHLREEAALYLFDHFEYYKDGAMHAFVITKDQQITEVPYDSVHHTGWDGNTQGIFVYKFGADVVEEDGKWYLSNRVDLHYPEKGFVTPQALEACNTVKRTFVGYIRFFASREIRPFLILGGLLPTRWKVKILERWLREFERLSHWVLEPYIPKDEYFMPLTKELAFFIERFLLEIGVRIEIARSIGRNIACLIEYDAAYRYRIQDLLSESSAERFKNPRKEIKRLLAILATRDDRIDLNEKFKSAGKLISLMLLIPTFKRAFKKSLAQAEFKNFQYDEADRYYVHSLGSYRFLGKTLQELHNEWVKIHNGNPPLNYIVSKL